jgi:1-acyl-sn-glycerol-3-phosphate acyltransferase
VTVRALDLAGSICRRMLPASERSRLAALWFHDAGAGYDVFGMNPEWVAAGAGLCRFLYRTYFRVSSHGSENIPREGAAILAANHGGTLPFDAAMLYLDVLHYTDPPRVPRVLADVFAPRLPFVSTLFARVGVAAGTRGNVRHLLETGELVVVFPEGMPAIGKPLSERYRLRDWRVGHAEVALRHRVPVVPVAIIGPDEQWPQIGRIESIHPFGIPYLPIPLTPLPLPVHYHVHYGAPIALHDELADGSPDDPAVVERAAARVKSAVAELLERGLRERRGVFR